MNKLKVYCEDPNCYPERAHRTDAGLDLKNAHNVELKPNTVEKIHTGIYLQIPEGFAGFIYPRSGLSTKDGITLANTVGVIDSDYRGEIICAVRWSPPYNTTNQVARFKIPAYSRIAQLVIKPVYTMEYEFVESVEELSNTVRGEGGFGHTGS